jgi:hypothetical protein
MRKCLAIMRLMVEEMAKETLASKIMPDQH